MATTPTQIVTNQIKDNAVTKQKIDSGFTLDQVYTAAADVAFGGFKITNIADGVNSTDAVTYQQLQAAIVGADHDRGAYDASTNTFPAGGGSGTLGAIKATDFWYVSVPGTLGGTPVVVGQVIFAKVDNPGQTASNWAFSDLNALVAGKADKVSGAVNGDIAGLDSNGNLTDTGLTSSTDNTLGGGSPSDNLLSTQKAVKEYTDNKFTQKASGVQNDIKLFDANGNDFDSGIQIAKIGGIWSSTDSFVPTEGFVDAQLQLKVDKTAIDTDGTLSANSDTRIASQRATKTYADTKVGKAATSTNGNLISFDVNGNALDSNIAANSVMQKIVGGTSGRILTDNGSGSAQDSSQSITATAISSSSTSAQVPTADLVYNYGNTKADKVSGAVAGDIATLDSNGNLVDSGIVAANLLSASKFVFSEVPVNSAGNIYNVANTPVSGTIVVYDGGLRLSVTNDYTISGSSINMNYPPNVGLYVDYIKA